MKYNHLLQSKLNCEILHDDLAFEARWAVAGDSIVIQLVAKLGEYLLYSSSYLEPAYHVVHFCHKDLDKILCLKKEKKRSNYAVLKEI